MKVLITRKIPANGIEILGQYKDIQIDFRQGPPLSQNELKKAVKGADAIIPVIPDQITKEILEAAGPNLKLVATYSIGYDHIDVSAATKLKIYVANTPGDLTESVAEHAFALMLAVGRKISEADRFTRAGKYKYWDPMLFMGPQFKGKTLGIIGFGRIGQHLAKIAKYGLDMELLYTDTMCNETAEKTVNAKFVTKDYLLEHSDIVSLNCILCPDTVHLIGERELKKMKPTAYLINTSRGKVIDEAALTVALKEGWIEGAGLDVFENEPEINGELMKLENVVLTPHIASATREARLEMSRMAAENVVEVLINKKPPKNLVNVDLTNSLF